MYDARKFSNRTKKRVNLVPIISYLIGYATFVMASISIFQSNYNNAIIYSLTTAICVTISILRGHRQNND